MLRRPGIWAANGHPGDTVGNMYSWLPGAITCFQDYLGPNQVHQHKARYPETTIIVRMPHPMNWQQDPVVSANNLGREVASKWSVIQPLDAYVYFANEINLHYENGDPSAGNQWMYETSAFYKRYGDWVRMTADAIKQRVPEMKLVCPPFAFGHHEDGAPDDDGKVTEGWAGYDYLSDTIAEYFDSTITFHAYWGTGAGADPKLLYDPELSSWYAFRWERVLKLFEARYGIQAKVIIDEAGSMDASRPEFTDEVLYYSTECLKDPRVLALTYFLWLDPTNSPGNVMNSWVQRIPDLNAHLSKLARWNLSQAPSPEPGPPEYGKVRCWAVYRGDEEIFRLEGQGLNIREVL